MSDLAAPKEQAAVSTSHWPLMRIMRVSASALVLMVAAYYLVVAFDNITNPDSNWVFVKGVLSEDGVTSGSGFEWRAIDAHWFQVLGYLGVIAFETLTGLLLAYAGVRGLRDSRSRGGWASAQRATFLGMVTGLLVFFLGFITIGGNWFVMYLNSKWNGLDPAFQNSVMTMFMAAFVVGILVADRLELPTSD
jgi:predicted small integral membrane protein